MNNSNVCIPSIDAKDLFLSNNYIKNDGISDCVGYNINKKNGELNLKKFINTLDFSLDLIKLREIYYSVYRRRTFSFFNEDKEYSYRVINVTFKYSCKAFNKIRDNFFVKDGYDFNDLVFYDSIAIDETGVIGVETNNPICNPIDEDLLGKYFSLSTIQDDDGNERYIYAPVKNIKTIKKSDDLRKDLYKNGFYCNGIHYVRFKRSGGAARVGKCLFIDEKLYAKIHKWDMCGITIKENDETDLAGLEAYTALTSSSIMDILTIDPKGILMVDDYESIFTDDAIVTKMNSENELISAPEAVQISNSIWDGQSLIDRKAMGRYKNKGMVLLRNRFFKSCCFNTNIQKWFSDNNITDISQLNGFTLATKIEDIKIITTPSSIKYLKFGTIEKWLNTIDHSFGVVKHDKPTHYFKGKMVRTHYQLLNTLQLSYSEVEELVKPSLDYVNLLNTNLEVLKFHIKYPEDLNIAYSGMKNKNEIVYNLLNFNEDFAKTKIFYDFKKDLCKSYIKNMKRGHILVDGTYATLFGNPVEMLQHSIGIFNGESVLGVGNVHTTRYDYGTELWGCRSPHVTMGNLLLANNSENELIYTYFNLTEEIICLNSIGENTLERLSGCDFDSDSMIVSNNKLLLKAAQKNYHLFKVPTNDVEARKTKRRYNAEQKADLDIKTSVNKIGEIINLSQELNTLLWHKMNHGSSFDDVAELYYDITMLDVMSCIEIDKAKKEFSVDNARELRKLKEKYYRADENGKRIKPNFLGFMVKSKAKTKQFFNTSTKSYQHHDTTMDYLQKCINKNRSSKTNASEFLPLSEIFKPDSFSISSVNYKQINNIVDLAYKTNAYISNLWATNNGIEKGVKYDMVHNLKYTLYQYLDGLRINENTMYTLLSYIDNPEYAKISKLLFYVLVNNNNSSFYNMLLAGRKKSFVIHEDQDGNIDLFGMKYSTTKS